MSETVAPPYAPAVLPSGGRPPMSKRRTDGVERREFLLIYCAPRHDHRPPPLAEAMPVASATTAGAALHLGVSHLVYTRPGSARCSPWRRRLRCPLLEADPGGWIARRWRESVHI